MKCKNERIIIEQPDWGGGEDKPIKIEANIVPDKDNTFCGYNSTIDFGYCNNPMILVCITANIAIGSYNPTTILSINNLIVKSCTLTRLDSGLSIPCAQLEENETKQTVAGPSFFTEQDVGLTIPIEITNIVYD